MNGANGIGPLQQPNRLPLPGLKPKDLIGVPWRVALALQEDGWYLRDDIIWHKPSPMPSSARDRTCKAHEYLFLLTKRPRYFFDWLGVSEPVAGTAKTRGDGRNRKSHGVGRKTSIKANETWNTTVNGLVSRRFARSVWKIAPKGFKGAHFATFPPQLVERCLLAGTSPAGCCAACGAPLERMVDRVRRPTRPGKNSKVNRASDDPDSPYEQHSGSVVGNRDPQRHVTDYVTAGWKRTCRCETEQTRPCVVLDPFLGSGTTLAVAKEWGREGWGIELNPQYAAMAEQRIGQVQPRITELAEVV